MEKSVDLNNASGSLGEVAICTPTDGNGKSVMVVEPLIAVQEYPAKWKD